MKRTIAVMALLLSPNICIAQQYTIIDLGTLGGSYSYAFGINDSGQVVGYATTTGDASLHAFRTAAESPINPATDDLGTFGGAPSSASLAFGINASGQVVGQASSANNAPAHAFRTAANSPINQTTDDLGTLGGSESSASGINDSGQVVGWAQTNVQNYYYEVVFVHAFRTAANSPINPATDDLGTLGGDTSYASGINDSGQVVGWSTITGSAFVPYHAFRTTANSPINPATDDLGTLGGSLSQALGINNSGQVVGWSFRTEGNPHAFLYSGGVMYDLNDLVPFEPGRFLSSASAINDSGQVVGSAKTTGDADDHAFLYSGGVMHDLNNLIPAESGRVLTGAIAINDAGQILAGGRLIGAGHVEHRYFLLTPNNPYKVFVQPPLSPDGSSIFSASRGVIPVKFTLTENDSPTCDLPAATISVTRTAGGMIGSVGEATYGMPANRSSNFRITDCQYLYNLAAKALGAGAYRVEITISGIVVGGARFALE